MHVAARKLMPRAILQIAPVDFTFLSRRLPLSFGEFWSFDSVSF
jgi:hypothetical protein